MKRSSPKKSDDDLRSEYGAEFFRNMKPNRFANRVKVGRVHTTSVRSAAAKRAKKRGS